MSLPRPPFRLLLFLLVCPLGLGAADTAWFQQAKFGLFMHWGLYSVAGNEWQGVSYHGSSEWLMHRLKIPAAQYAQLASRFDPVDFDAAAWARFVRESGARYLVITAKHHEGFAMFGTKVSPFNIVDATPYGKDPMTSLAQACRDQGIQFGFYYSQFLDWHEPNGGGNTWDFPGKKDYQRYYDAKSVPQVRELLSNYGPLGLVWFDMPGGLSKDETRAFMARVRALQPDCLVSSRVGNGFGDFRDFGDSELPTRPIAGRWEALFTHNDSWGFDRNDFDFKTPAEIIRLLASTSARGGNLLLNVGPDGLGRIPDFSQRYLREVGRWLAANGESIYGTQASPLPDQTWGVATLRRGTPSRLYLHVFTAPRSGSLLVPNFTARAAAARLLRGGSPLTWRQEGSDVRIDLPPSPADAADTVIALDFTGELRDAWSDAPQVISHQYDRFVWDAARAELTGKTELERFDSSGYFGDWKHDTCAVGMTGPGDTAGYTARIVDPGDYRVSLDYACPAASSGTEGVVLVGGQRLDFDSLHTGEYDHRDRLLFVHHTLGIVRFDAPQTVRVVIRPVRAGRELFQLRRVVIEPEP